MRLEQTQTVDEQPSWLEEIPEDQWAVYRETISAVKAEGIPFVLGGAFALAAYTGHWRNTKDLDLFILAADRDRVVDLTSRIGLEDYHDQLEYDRGWIYRACQGEIIVDVIWEMANRRAQVDEAWLTRGRVLNVRGEPVRVLPVEELIWAKLYIMHRDRCDWTDVLNLLYSAGPVLDWPHLLDRIGPDTWLLAGMLATFAWLCPGRAEQLPAWVWERLHLHRPERGTGPEFDRHRADLLDTRPWFFPTFEDAPDGEPG